jgi:hypothetical protein
VILSEPSSKPEQPPAAPLYRKPRADVFTMLLVLALLAILLAIAALYGVMKEYEFKFLPKDGPRVSWSQPALGQGPDSWV